MLLLPILAIYLLTAGCMVSGQSSHTNDDPLLALKRLLSSMEEKFIQQQKSLTQLMQQQNQISAQINEQQHQQSRAITTVNEIIVQQNLIVNEKLDRQNEAIVYLNRTLVQKLMNVTDQQGQTTDQVRQVIDQVNEKIDQQYNAMLVLNQTLFQERNITDRISQTVDQQTAAIRKLDENVSIQNEIVAVFNQSMARECTATKHLSQMLGQQQNTIQRVIDLLRQFEKASQCYALSRPSVQHATLQTIQQTISGTIATFVCHLGYQFSNELNTSSTTCNGDSWSMIESSCSKIHCPRLTIPNAKLTAYNTSYQSKVTVTCLPGYQVSDNLTTTVLTCQADGIWSLSTTPVCNKIHCPRLTIPNAELTAYNTSYQSEVTVTCVSGYHVSNNHTAIVLTCQANSTWSLPTTPVCKRNALRASLTQIIPGLGSVDALTAFNNQLFATSRSQITVYDTTTFEPIRNIAVPGIGSNMYGLVPCPPGDNCLYVSDFHNNKVHKVINLSPIPGSNITTTTTTSWPVGSQPTGLSVNRQHNLLVAYWSREKIDEYTPEGSLVREIPGSLHNFHAVEHFNGTLAASSDGPVHGVCLMSVDGRVLHSYGRTAGGSGPGQMNGARGLAVDSDGVVLVADESNNRILVLNPTLSEARPLPLPLNSTGPISWPRGLWLDESRGRLYVGEALGSYRVLVFDDVFNLASAFTP